MSIEWFGTHLLRDVGLLPDTRCVLHAILSPSSPHFPCQAVGSANICQLFRLLLVSKGWLLRTPFQPLLEVLQVCHVWALVPGPGAGLEWTGGRSLCDTVMAMGPGSRQLGPGTQAARALLQLASLLLASSQGEQAAASRYFCPQSRHSAVYPLGAVLPEST